jgi:hypothetical protein
MCIRDSRYPKQDQLENEAPAPENKNG